MLEITGFVKNFGDIHKLEGWRFLISKLTQILSDFSMNLAELARKNFHHLHLSLKNEENTHGSNRKINKATG